MPIYYSWNHEKNEKLKRERGISFEQIIRCIEDGNLLDVKNNENYKHQQNLIVTINNYCYVVPFVKTEEGYFLKTIIPSRKTTKEYLGGHKI